MGEVGETTAKPKPWAANRRGDPRQLRFEAAVLEARAAETRASAKALLTQAAEGYDAAATMDEAARDYRQWAKEQE